MDDKAYRREVAAIAGSLETDVEKGLAHAEAAKRRAEVGPNELTTKQPLPGWRNFLGQFTSGLVILLIVAAVISGVLWFVERESALPFEALAILAIILLNAGMGFLHQTRAEQAVAALRQMSAAQATVVRGGERQRLPPKELVSGDVILIEEGDTIPADARLIQSTALQTAEASLTGESTPVFKDVTTILDEAPVADRRNMIFSGTTAVSGRGRAIVTATGMATEMGGVAGLLEQTPDETTPLQKELDRVGRILGITVFAIAAVIVATILIVEKVEGLAGFIDVLVFGVALAVAAVPEGLPAIVTAVLALGVERMASRKAIVRNLSAVETLGSANVIATDKTGTLTRNEMTVRRLVTASGQAELTGIGYAPRGELRAEGGLAVDGAQLLEVVRLLSAADRANNAVLQEQDGRWMVQGDPTEGALIVAAQKAGLVKQLLDTRFVRVGEVPFSSERKLMSTIEVDAERAQSLRTFTKGAPDVLLSRCTHELAGDTATPLARERREAILALNDQLADEALRTLGFAFRTLPVRASSTLTFDGRIEKDFVFLGLVGMIDPPREDARVAVTRARSAGIRVIMITGDHPRTAARIAVELGIGDEGRVTTGAELEAMGEAELQRVVRDVSIYARVNPEHKLRIVEALQRLGMTVAMTGDGVNDAPALKKADIGIAMGITGTDVAKQAADMVLADDNFATIVTAVEEGRAVFSNIRKFLRYLLSSNVGEVMTMFFGVVLVDVIGLHSAQDGLVLPLVATQILWINLVTDGAPALALGIDPADPGGMNGPPRPRGEGVITFRMWAGIFFVGAIMAAGTLVVLDATLPGGLIEGSGSVSYGQTMAFTTLTLFQLFNVFNARSDERSAFGQLFTNRWLWGAVALSVCLHTAVIYMPVLRNALSTTPLSAYDWAICASVASSVLWLRELSKLAAGTRAANAGSTAGDSG